MRRLLHLFSTFFFFNDTATTEIYTLSLHDALPIFRPLGLDVGRTIARLEPDRERGATEPLLHRGADVGRCGRRVALQRLLVEIGIARIDLAFGERDGLAAEAADLLEAADPPGDVLGRGAAHFVLGRPAGDILGEDLVEPPLDQLGVDARLHRR